MPEDVTVEDVEELRIEAWRLGIKAVALPRQLQGRAAARHPEEGWETGSPEAATAALAGGRQRRSSSASSARDRAGAGAPKLPPMRN
jgi:ribonucleotide reductase alpha subunit